MTDSTDSFRVDEIEYNLLSLVLTDPSLLASVRSQLRVDDFGLGAHRMIWSALADAFDANRSIDLETLRVELRQRKHLEEVEQKVRLSMIPSMRIQTGAFELVSDWAETIAKHARARRIRNAVEHIVTVTNREELDPQRYAESVSASIETALRAGTKSRDCWLDDETDELYKRLVDEHEETKIPNTLLTGIKELDKSVGGLHGGQVMIVAGRTGQGKTAFATTIALNLALRNAPPVLFASLEMTPQDMAARAVAAVAMVSQSDLRTAPKLKPEEMERVRLVSRKIARRIRLVVETDIDVNELRARARAMKAKYGLSLVIVDYLQLVTPVARSRGTRERDVAEISRGLKRLAMELEVPVLALAQLNRQADEREAPVLSDLRESGSIEQDASSVLFLCPSAQPHDKEQTQVVVAKNRFGACPRFNVRFVRQLTRFENYDGT